MSEPFIAEIRMFGGNFAPRGWAFCNGGVLPISQNTALFSLIGTIYGGNGQTTMALPNMQGRAPMYYGQGPGLTAWQIGEQIGTESVTLTEAQIPNHTHTLRAHSSPSTTFTPTTETSMARSVGGNVYQSGATDVSLAPEALQVVGGSQPHNNMQPYLALTFIIALEGIFPSRS